MIKNSPSANLAARELASPIITLKIDRLLVTMKLLGRLAAKRDEGARASRCAKIVHVLMDLFHFRAGNEKKTKRRTHFAFFLHTIE